MEKNEVFVSVVIPAYNAQKYIEKTVRSVLKQTYTNFEIVIVDDCSTDETYTILQALEKEDKRIRVLQNETNSGVSITRNYAIAESKGKYVVLLDADDLWVETKLEKQVQLLEKTKAQIAYCSYGFIDENDKEILRPFIVPETTNFEATLAKSVISCSTAMLERQLFEKYTFEPDVYHEDYVLWLKMLRDNVKAAGDTDVLAYYRLMKGTRSSNKINVAIKRWQVYRKSMKMPLGKSVVAMVQYVINALIKYN
jgi:teichuronic acid biosynthesis glycosyltransferase TuaG